MNRKIRLLIIISILMLISSLIYPLTTKTDAAFSQDIEKWIMCSIENGDKVLKAKSSDWIPYLMYSKSAIGEYEKEGAMYNRILELSGYGAGKNPSLKKSPFDVMLFSGLRFSSYRGEFKYYDVQPCVDDEQSLSMAGNFGQFYEKRKETLASYSEVTSSTDIRAKTFNESLLTSIWKGAGDMVGNFFMTLAKFILSIVLAVLHFSLSDISTEFGLGEQFQQETFTKLYEGFFTPLVVIMFVFTGIYIFHQGIVKRQIREAVVGGLGKTLICFVVAIFLATNTQYISVPNKVAVTGQALLISAMNKGYDDGGNGDADLCNTEVGFSKATDITSPNYLDEIGRGMQSVIGCRMWSEFLLKPFIAGQFGTEYKDLDKLDNVNHKWVGEPKVDIGGQEFTNWGLMYVSVMTDKHKPLDGIDSPPVGTMNKDYYRIIDALSNYDEDFYLNDNKFDVDGVEKTEADSIKVDNEEDIDYDHGYPVPQNNDPLKEWSYFVGNHNSNKIKYALVACIFAVVGSIAPLVFGFASLVYGLGVTFLMLFAPVFLLLGCWGGRGNSILMKYWHTLISTVFKRIVAGGLLFISILLVTSVMSLVNEIGYFTSIIFMCIVTYLLTKNKDELISKLSHIGGVSDDAISTENMNKVGNTAKGAVRTAGVVGAGAVAGSIASKKAGGSAFKGGFNGAAQVMKDKAYMTPAGRQAHIVYDMKTKEKDKSKGKGDRCALCGVSLAEDTEVWVDQYGNYVCEDCASADGFDGYESVIKDNIKDESVSMSESVSYVKKDGATGDNKSDYEKVSHIDYSDLMNIGYYDKDSMTEESANKAKEKLNDTRRIIKEELKDNKPIRKLYVPDPLKAYINIPYLTDVAANGDTEEVKKILLEACDSLDTDINNKVKKENKDGGNTEETQE